MIRRLAGFAALLALAGCTREATVAARPALWVVRDADTTVWLLGTVHALPANIDWRTPVIRTVTTRADAVAFELSDDAAATDAAFDRASRTQSLPPLTARVPVQWRAALAAAMTRAGLAPGSLDGRTTWGAAAILGSSAAARDGASADAGVERVLAAEFRAAGKPRLGLETTADQFGAFGELSAPAQLALLRGTIRGVLGHRDYRETIAAWGRGDVNALTASAADELAGSPELADRLLRRRNTRFAAWIVERMQRPGTLLVAIGAGHLAGPGSVVALLERRGLRVERVQ